jgi:hypothetical protein
VHAAVSERRQAVAPAEREEQLARPSVRNREPDLFGSLGRGGLAKARADAGGGGTSRLFLAFRRRAGEQRLDLAQLLAKNPFIRSGNDRPPPTAPIPW